MSAPRFLNYPTVAALLDDPATIWRHSAERYQMPSELAAHADELVAARTAGRTWQNELKISITHLPSSPNDALISRTACYFDQLATHDQPDPIKLGPLLSPLHLNSEGNLLDLSASRFPNPIGGSVVAVCADGVVALGRRSAASLVDSGTLDVTASGSFMAPVGDHTSSAKEMLLSQALRELEEETGAPPEAVRTAHVIGFGRHLGRAGLFNVQVLVLLDLPSTRLVAADDLVALHFSPPTSSPEEFASLIAAHRTDGANLSWWDAVLSAGDPHAAGVLSALYAEL